MARRRNRLARLIVIMSILFLAGFGSYTLYQDNKDDAMAEYSKVEKKAKAIKEALKD